VIFDLVWPAAGRRRLEQKIQLTLAVVRRCCAQAGDLPALAAACEKVSLEMPAILLPHLLPGVIAGQAPLQILLRTLAPQVPGGPDLALELTRGLPYNVTTQMDLALWRTAQAIRCDPPSRQHFTGEPAGELAAAYLAGRLPAAAQAALSAFLDVYGLRGVGEIDLGRTRWHEDPSHIIQVLKSYLQMDDGQASPEAVFQRGASQSAAALQRLAATLAGRRNGWLKARLVRLLGRRVRELGGLRETPKFVVVRILGLIRTALLQAGQKLVEQGLVEQPSDVLYLHLEELKNLPARPWSEWRALIAARRQVYQRELGRKRVPRLLLSDGSAYYEGSSSTLAAPGVNGAAITGSPVSPGVSEGMVRVVLDPHGVQLIPGEILVCPATDPAWTPLFLAAGGLVMEVGGMMTHGSVVAREYGIPAVVGVSQATTRLRTGMRVRVDGSNGLVAVLE